MNPVNDARFSDTQLLIGGLVLSALLYPLIQKVVMAALPTHLQLELQRSLALRIASIGTASSVIGIPTAVVLGDYLSGASRSKPPALPSSPNAADDWYTPIDKIISFMNESLNVLPFDQDTNSDLQSRINHLLEHAVEEKDSLQEDKRLHEQSLRLNLNIPTTFNPVSHQKEVQQCVLKTLYQFAQAISESTKAPAINPILEALNSAFWRFYDDSIVDMTNVLAAMQTIQEAGLLRRNHPVTYPAPSRQSTSSYGKIVTLHNVDNAPPPAHRWGGGQQLGGRPLSWPPTYLEPSDERNERHIPVLRINADELVVDIDFSTLPDPRIIVLEGGLPGILATYQSLIRQDGYRSFRHWIFQARNSSAIRT